MYIKEFNVDDAGYLRQQPLPLVKVQIIRICIRIEFHFRKYGLSRCMWYMYIRVMYVLRMKRTCYVSTAYALCSILIYGVSVVY